MPQYSPASGQGPHAPEQVGVFPDTTENKDGMPAPYPQKQGFPSPVRHTPPPQAEHMELDSLEAETISVDQSSPPLQCANPTEIGRELVPPNWEAQILQQDAMDNMMISPAPPPDSASPNPTTASGRRNNTEDLETETGTNMKAGCESEASSPPAAAHRNNTIQEHGNAPPTSNEQHIHMALLDSGSQDLAVASGTSDTARRDSLEFDDATSELSSTPPVSL